MSAVPLDLVRINEPPKLRTVSLEDFLGMDFPPREQVLAPILPSQGLVMLFGPRGIAKTHVALGIGFAVASGSAFLRWEAPKPRRTMIVDGEMPAVALQERLRAIAAAHSEQPPPDFLRIVTQDLLPGAMPNLGAPEGQAFVDDALEGTELLILDNLSSLVRTGRENEADDWQVMQEWLLRLRRRGVSVVIVHHAGKGGAQRGTSRREDVLDTVIALRRPADYNSSEGARFEVHLEKARGLHGEAAKPFEARLDVRNGAASWTTRDLEDVDLMRVVDLHKQGASVRDIAEELQMPRSTVQRRIDKARERGLTVPPSRP